MVNSVEDELYKDWITRMHTELTTLRQRRASGSMQQTDYLHTMQLVTEYSHFLGSAIINYYDIMAFFKIFVESLINPLRKANVVTDDLDIRPCELWERFAEYYLRFIKVDFLPPSSETKITHKGKNKRQRCRRNLRMAWRESRGSGKERTFFSRKVKVLKSF